MELTGKDAGLRRVDSENRDNRVEDLFIGFGFDMEKMNPGIIARLKLMNEVSGFVEDERHTIQYARRLFEYYEINPAKTPFSEVEKRNIVGGLIFSDIGKTGPAEANEKQQRLILRLYGVEGIRPDGEINTKTSLGTILKIKYPETVQEDIELLKQMELDPNMPIEKLWRSHAGWTKSIIQNDGIPKEEVGIAAIHHILEGDNSHLIKRGTSEFMEDFGENKKFDREEKVVILLDKYGAFIDRIADMTHEKAIRRLKDLIHRIQEKARKIIDDPNEDEIKKDHCRLYAYDEEYFELIDDFKAAFKETREEEV